MSRLPHFVLALCLLTPAAHAEDQSPNLQQDLRTWLSRVYGAPGADLAQQMTITPQGDAYRVSLKLGGTVPGGVMQRSEGIITATLQKLSGGFWAVRDLHQPDSVVLTFTAPQPGGPDRIEVRSTGQDGSGQIDPSFATPSEIISRAETQTLALVYPNMLQGITLNAVTQRNRWQARADGLLDTSIHSTTGAIEGMARLPDGRDLTLHAAGFQMAMRSGGVDMGQLVRMVSGITSMVDVQNNAVLARPSQGQSPGQQIASAEKIIDFLSSMAETSESDISTTGLRIALGNQVTTAGKVALGGGYAADGRNLRSRFGLTIEQLALPALLPPALQALLPHRFALVLRLDGLQKAALLAMIQTAIATPTMPPDNAIAQVDAALAQGPAQLALEKLALDVGPAAFDAGGTITVSSLQQISGQGEIRATGMAELIALASRSSELQQAAPALLLLRGLGRQKGDTTIWSITYDNNQLMINDTDFTAMLGMME